ncbi:MAG: prenyltransferase [Porticoccaceae bacterium]
MKKLLGIIRAPFLLLVPACLAPAFAIAWQQTGTLDLVSGALVIIAAFAAHIAVNALNEYEDFRSGLDFNTTRTPFSGGSGTLVAHPGFAPMALAVAVGALFVTIAIGIYFAWHLGGAALAPGLIGIAIIVAYTRWINRFPLLCLFAPGVGFGLLMVNLTVLVLTGRVYSQSLWASLPVTLLASNLLLVNQLPDVAADRNSGRKHIAIAWGPRWARRASALLLGAGYLSVLAGWLLGILPATSLLAWLSAPFAIFVVARLWNIDAGRPDELIPAMAANVVTTLSTPVLLAVGILMA